MTPRAISRNIQFAVAERARAGDARSRVQINLLTNVIKRSWFELVALIEKGGQRQTVKLQAVGIIGRMVAATERTIEPMLEQTANWGFDTAFDVWVSYLPAGYWRLAFADVPEAALMESVEFNFPEPGGPGPGPGNPGKGSGKRSALEKVIKRRRFKDSPPSKQVTITTGKFPAGKPKPLPKTTQVKPAVAGTVKARIKPSRKTTLQIIRSRGWKGRMKKWTKLVTNYDKVAELIADGVDRGLKPETIINRVKPFVHKYAASARRLVRTEMARIENKMMEETYKAFNDIIEGFQIINPLDERTRPHHASRAGRIYWNDKRKKPHASERPELPDEANCRCCYAPILTAPAPAELLKGPRVDTRTFAGFFNNKTDEEKAELVGKKRWQLMKKKSARPSWWDAIDPDTGRLIDVERLKKEKPRQTLARRKKLRARKSKDIAAARRSLKYWPPEPK